MSAINPDNDFFGWFKKSDKKIEKYIDSCYDKFDSKWNKNDSWYDYDKYGGNKYKHDWKITHSGPSISREIEKDLITHLTKKIDLELLNSLKGTWTDSFKKTESDEDKVVRILKGDFEKKFGMSFEKFIEVYNKLLDDSPEKLI